MERLKAPVKVLVAFVLLNVVAFVVNIIQAGKRTPDGRSVREILRFEPEEATFEHIERLSRSETMQLFYAASAPAFDSMKGEYEARVLGGGVLGGATAFFTHHFFPTGTPALSTRWEGKGFEPEGENSGWGYNLFSRKGGGDIFRARRMRTYVGPTTIGKDGSDSFHLDYSAFNSDLIKTMHDEVRQVNNDLYICAGYMAPFGGSMNPGPFVLIGPPTELPVDDAGEVSGLDS
jgi:hypothetical protein